MPVQNVLGIEDVPAALGHRLAVDHEMLAVEVVAGERLPRQGLYHRYVVIVMPVDIVDAAAVDVDLVSEVLGDHRRVLDVPGGSASAYFGVPGAQIPVGVPVPENEIPPIPAAAIVRVLLEADLLFRPPAHVQPEQLAEILELEGIEKHLVLVPVGQPALQQLLDQVHGLGDAGRGPRYVRRELDGEDLRLLVEVLRHLLCDLFGLPAQGHGLFQHLVLHIGEVDHPVDVVAQVLEVANQNILVEEGAVIPYMRTAVRGGSAGEDPGFSLPQRLECLLAATHGVVQFQHASPRSPA